METVKRFQPGHGEWTDEMAPVSGGGQSCNFLSFPKQLVIVTGLALLSSIPAGQ